MVYKAMVLDESLEDVALKVLAPELLPDESAVERFMREARMTSLLDHENVVVIKDAGLTSEGYAIIVMELLPGESLADELERTGTVGWRRALAIIGELCDALGHAHGRRLIHRDLKPDNVQLFRAKDERTRVKLLDFGVAYHAADVSFSGPAPGSSGVSGTPAYMSPEQIQALPLDGRSDLYSVGVLLFQLLCGRVPFQGTDAVVTCRAHLDEKPPDLASLLPLGHDVPSAVLSLVQQLLAKRRVQRPGSVGALFDVLCTVLPKEQWPKSMSPGGQTKSASSAHSGVTASVHGVPPEDLLNAGQASAAVALVHIELLENDEQLLYPTQPDPSLVTLLDAWIARLGHTECWTQRPEPRTVRCYFGLFDTTHSAEVLTNRAFEHVLRLVGLVARDAARRQDSLLLRVGMTLKQFEAPACPDGAHLCDEDVDEVYWLAREAAPGEVLSDTEAAFALRLVADIEPIGDVVVPPSGRLVRCWRLAPR